MNTLNNIEKRIKNISEQYPNDMIGGFITGDGPIPCDIMFVGEAPGKTEVELGKPFVGKAGANFEKYLNSIGLRRDNVRITNTCYFRPIKRKISKSGRETISNRPPKVSEINLFKDILNDEINLVNPKIIVTLGNIPLKRLTDFKSIGECHGNLIFNKEINRNIFPMYHPSSLIYNKSEEFLNIYRNDWEKLSETLLSL
ncbi:uracil DNA glycosylase superfamily protein [Clostridium tepidiprofundi DSM 19306]|uniref:Uracil DNA glycosylase superfamily protein n=1 Tax=Clostridium tepidiprofundi DSM 19306 TaxID=1121338 RepID=A0A151AV74_9CLOT|nr:uracil-DNA glycosylase [Clostridium tepidiprofundi]KYH31569.1 uracil DNA glycosylase superfamily protein [Clostridium tepidiprofundi DSM 19306]